MSKQYMLGFLYMNVIECSLLSDYHSYTYGLLTKNVELCVILVVISFFVLLMGRISSYASMVPMVAMILKFTIYKLANEIKEIEFFKYILGDNFDKIKEALENLDKYVVAIPLMSILVTYLLIGIIEVTFLIACFFILYILADTMGLTLETDKHLILISGITLIIIGMMLMYILRKIKDVMIVSTCCYYFSIILLTCFEVVGYIDIDIKNYFDDGTNNNTDDFTSTEFLVIFMTFTSILFQYVLCPAFSSLMFDIKSKPAGPYKVEPAKMKVDDLCLENQVLKERLDYLERRVLYQNNVNATKAPQNE